MNGFGSLKQQSNGNSTGIPSSLIIDAFGRASRTADRDQAEPGNGCGARGPALGERQALRQSLRNRPERQSVKVGHDLP
jgi:hypothetical protein